MKKIPEKRSAKPTKTPKQAIPTLLGGLVLMYFAYTEFHRPPSSSRQTEHTAEQNVVSSVKPEYENPELTFYQEHFCTGYQSSDSCPNLRPVHPVVEEVERRFGISWLEYLALEGKAPSEPKRKYMRQIKAGDGGVTVTTK